MNDSASTSIPIRGWYFDDTIDLRKFRAANPHYPVIQQDPLMLELERDRFAVITKFGGVVFWNYEAESARRLRDEIYGFISDRSFDDRLEELLPVTIGGEADEVEATAVRLVNAEPRRVSIVARAMAQSMALERLEYQLDDVMEPIMVYVNQLRDSGLFRARFKDIARKVGFAMTVKYSILKNLTLFDKPDETWESPELEKLYRSLYDITFDLTDRLRALDRKLSFQQESVELLMDMLDTRINLRLEWAIVILIVFEIFLTLYDYFIK